jgi:hypothetical protein
MADGSAPRTLYVLHHSHTDVGYTERHLALLRMAVS